MAENQHLTWWEIAESWREASKSAKHGELHLLRDDFFARRGIETKPSTLRRYMSALDFVETLARNHPTLAADQIRRVPLDNLQALRRLSRFPGFDVKPHVARAMAGSLSADELKTLEEGWRSRAAGDGAPTDKITFRLRSRPFRKAALAAYELIVASAGGKLTPYNLAGPLPWLLLDGTVRDKGGKLHGLRLMASTATPADPERIREAVVFAMAATRVLRTMTFIAQGQGDASALAGGATEARLSAVGVMWLEQDSGQAQLREILAARPSGRRDLALAWKDHLAKLDLKKEDIRSAAGES